MHFLCCKMHTVGKLRCFSLFLREYNKSITRKEVNENL